MPDPYDDAIFARKMRQSYFVIAALVAFLIFVAYKVVSSLPTGWS